MRKITSSELVDLLNGDFKGEVAFSGRVFIRLRTDKENPSLEELDNEDCPTFFHSTGPFSLQRIGRNEGVNEGSYSLKCRASEFFFKTKEGEKIKSEHREKYGDVIAFSIDFPAKAVLQIEPREINY